LGLLKFGWAVSVADAAVVDEEVKFASSRLLGMGALRVGRVSGVSGISNFEVPITSGLLQQTRLLSLLVGPSISVKLMLTTEDRLFQFSQERSASDKLNRVPWKKNTPRTETEPQSQTH
jgi:hypothetical protein